LSKHKKDEKMVALWIMIVALCLLVALSSALLALRFQYHWLDRTNREREAWQQAQESRQRTWEVRQGKHILEAEQKLVNQLKDARREWRVWSVETEQKQQEWQDRAEIEPELARLPHVEQLELSRSPDEQHRRPQSWRPPKLYRAELNGRDLSYRYLGQADLREAQLIEANLHMADLCGAVLTGADLERANLTGANLAGVDLRGANLAGANLLVADLHGSLLQGANLTGARNLSPQQLQTALYDSSTLLEPTLAHPSENRVVLSTQQAPGVSNDVRQSISAAQAPEVASQAELVASSAGQNSSETSSEASVSDEPGQRFPTPTRPLSESESPARKRRGVGERKKTGGGERKKAGGEKQVEAMRKIIQLPTRSSQAIPLSILDAPKRNQRTSGALSLSLEMAEELEKTEKQQALRPRPPSGGQNAG
jgi:hypothetical protein